MVDTIDGVSLEQELIVLINWLSVILIDNGQYDQRGSWEQELIVLINWLSIVSIDQQLFSWPRADDCLTKLVSHLLLCRTPVDWISCYRS